jgi:2-dehydro-3-deoxygluconokinase
MPQDHDPPSRVVCFGETMAQLVPDDGLPLNTAATFTVRTAGAESNVAQTLAQLGIPVSWVSRLGEDALGQRITRDLAATGVDVSAVRFLPGRRTGLFLKDPGPHGSTVTYYRAGSAASTMSPADVDTALAFHPAVLHLSGVTPALSDSCAAAIRYALTACRAQGIHTSFDVNYRPALWPSPAVAANQLLDLANAADTVFVGLDEAEALWDLASATEVRRLIGQPSTLVVKDGARAAVSFGRADEPVVVPALPIAVREPVGAGDAFASGWLYGRLHDLPCTARLRLGHLMAGAALTSLGDHFTIPDTPERLLAVACASSWAGG